MPVKFVISYDGAGFTALAPMLALGLLHPNARLILPGNPDQRVQAYLRENEDTMLLADPLALDLRELTELYIIGNPEDHNFCDLSRYKEAAGEIVVYSSNPSGTLTSQLVQSLVREEMEISPLQATFLALGIYEETRCLTSGATPQDFYALARLFERQAHSGMLQKYLQNGGEMDRQLMFEKLVSNYQLDSIAGYRVLFCRGEVWDFLDGLTLLGRELLKGLEAQMLVAIFPFHGNNYINALALPEASLDLLEVFSPFNATGSPANAAFFQEGNPDVMMEEVKNLLFKTLSAKTTAADIMNTYVKSIAPETTLSDARDQLEKMASTSLLVAVEGAYIGIISHQQVNKAVRFGYGHDPVEHYMEKNVPTVPPHTSLDTLLGIMARTERELIPVVDSKNRLAGTVSLKELVQAIHQEQNPLTRGLAAIPAEENLRLLIEERVPKYMQGVLHMIGKIGDEMQLPVHAVGGFVRDLILGMPNEDVDVVVEGDALTLATKVNDILGGKLTENKDFGTARITTPRQRLDFSTARQEFYAQPAALPEVERASLKKDLFRRDFTINTMAFQLNLSRFGHLFDYFKGLQDLESKTLRVLYSLSFVEDPLRIFRAVRFAVRLGFEIEPESKTLIKNALRSKVLNKVSKDRLGKELGLAFREKRVMLVMKELADLGVLAQIFPKLTLTSENFRIIREIEELLLQTDPAEREQVKPTPLYIAALFYGKSRLDLFSKLHRIRISSREVDMVAAILHDADTAAGMLTEEGLPPEQVYDIFNKMTFETRLFVLALARGSLPRQYYESFSRKMKNLNPTLTGRDLLNMGLEPGPVFKDILNMLKLEKIKGKLESVEDEIYYIKKHFLPGKGIDS
jgi:tRNA nucleotidyltransferase (CCA-adding enzyme)